MPGTRATVARSIVGRPPKPDFLEYSHPTELPKPPSGAIWGHELKWDGYRAQVHLKAKRVKIWTRNRNDWTMKFHPIALAATELRADDAILDGEVVALGPDGVSNFLGLRSQLATKQPNIIYQAFDLLWLNGEDLRPLPLRERKARLEKLTQKSRTISFVPYLEEAGARVYAGACKLHLEGIVSKKLDSPYRTGRTLDWIKTKCEVTETLHVIGYTLNDSKQFKGLLLGREKDGTVTYAGTVENGFDQSVVKELMRQLPKLKSKTALAKGTEKKSGVSWVRPEVLVEVRYPNKTADGRLRHPAFKGLRDDLVAGRLPIRP